MPRGTVVQINVSNGGVPKTPISRAEVGVLGISGDQHRYLKHHGGPKRALLLIASEVVDQLRREGWPVFYGALGENITTGGLDHGLWRPGARYRIGSVLIELTTPREPCRALRPYGAGINKRLYDGKVRALDSSSPHWGESGFYVSVLETGAIAPGDIIECIEKS